MTRTKIINLYQELVELWIQSASMFQIEYLEHILFDLLVKQLSQNHIELLDIFKDMAPQIIFYDSQYEYLRKEIRDEFKLFELFS